MSIPKLNSFNEVPSKGRIGALSSHGVLSRYAFDGASLRLGGN